MHLLLYLVSMQFIEDVDESVWMQTDPGLVVLCVLQSLTNLKHLVSILNCPWDFVIPSLHVHLQHWKGALQTLQFVC